jgi:hypothetical protein
MEILSLAAIVFVPVELMVRSYSVWVLLISIVAEPPERTTLPVPAINVPPEMVKVDDTVNACPLSRMVPAACEKVDVVRAAFKSTVPAYPLETVTVVTLIVLSIVALLSQSASKTIVSDDDGAADALPLPHAAGSVVFQLEAVLVTSPSFPTQ